MIDVMHVSIMLGLLERFHLCNYLSEQTIHIEYIESKYLIISIVVMNICQPE